MSIERATAQDLPAVLDLLAESDLPSAGLAEHADAVLVARAGGRVVGSAAVELYGANALLRSVAVTRDDRGRGLGRELVSAAIDLAREHGAADLYLLTTTAAPYYVRLGFDEISRAGVPAPVHASEEFQSACSATAVAMHLRL